MVLVGDVSFGCGSATEAGAAIRGLKTRFDVSGSLSSAAGTDAVRLGRLRKAKITAMVPAPKTTANITFMVPEESSRVALPIDQPAQGGYFAESLHAVEVGDQVLI